MYLDRIAHTMVACHPCFKQESVIAIAQESPQHCEGCHEEYMHCIGIHTVNVRLSPGESL